MLNGRLYVYQIHCVRRDEAHIVTNRVCSAALFELFVDSSLRNILYVSSLPRFYPPHAASSKGFIAIG